ncbi:thymidine kinase [Heterostelium album PN500]|uniref:Thymidine kinase n=1 Tax=Heterostelium pallidum (strain ATCC 26659 / Pp 5 / PN500) TaxID=670386 RepID=D3BG91_HETP5|nr:thymidine kinase [Heterostelium album PN500]EFA79491.1 thymidine kinase [Heterostelium album PN500]|eukprot:XP_020431612.1 thymidine kinase [Heterostelium album PN500]
MKHVQQMFGRIQVIFGPMFSGKTTELIRRIKRFNFANKKCLLIKYSKDIRYNGAETDILYTHDKQNYTALPCSRLEEVKQQALEYDVIGVDEGQFINVILKFPDIVSFSEDLANNGKTVIVAALDGTFQRKSFPALELVPKAEEITKLSAICMVCYRDAPFSKRIVPNEEIELIGGADMYISVCRECYHKDTNVNNLKSSK